MSVVCGPGVFPEADDVRALGRALATVLRAGDLLVLTGDLGAGKTTLTQGIGAGLGVRGGVTSPTFVIARVHPSLGDGPALVHVDAYRLGSIAELDDMDLDSALAESVTVVEWGEGLAEDLDESHLAVSLVADPATETRRVTLTGVGPRWSTPGARAALAALVSQEDG
ncbi:MAG: tRNA (adenosine(37)-N6)-threonylcarbamoyltransferase complex ATPase subunit type 1 TsaE [Dermatophilaceae bacterium]